MSDVDKDQEIKAIAGNVVDALSGIEESFRLAKLTLLKRENELFGPLYARREKLTSAIPRFWSTVLSIEEELVPYIKESESDLLKSLVTLRVERLADPRSFSLFLHFSKNEYLENNSLLLTKVFTFNSGVLTSHAVNVSWKTNHDLVARAKAENRLSFFSILGFTGHATHVDQESDDPEVLLEDIAVLLADEIYPHALSYFTDALAPPPPSPSIEEMSHSFLDTYHGKTQFLSPEMETYAAQKSTMLDERVMGYRGESILHYGENKLITTNQAQFISLLVGVMRPSRVLEVGCFTGFSASCIKLAGAGEVLTLECDAELSSFAKLGIHAMGLSEDITVMLGDAHESIKTVKGPFDLIFIDAEKTGYLAYFKVIHARNLLSKDGVILVDNTLQRGRVASDEELDGDLKRDVDAMREFNDYLVSSTEYTVCVVPAWDGLTMVKRSFII